DRAPARPPARGGRFSRFPRESPLAARAAPALSGPVTPGSASVADRSKPVVQTDFGGMDVAEAVVEAKRSARQDRPGRGCYRTAGLESVIVAKRDEHVLGLDAPIRGKCPLDSAANGPGGDSVAVSGRNEPVAASDGRVLAAIDDGGAGRDESSATLHVNERAVPGGGAQARRHQAVPIPGLGAPQHVESRLCADQGVGIESIAPQTYVAGFAFETEHEGRPDRLPVAAERAAGNDAGIEVGAPRMRRHQPRRSRAARIGQELAGWAETVLALIGEDAAVVAVPGAANETAAIAAGPSEGRH